MPPIVGDLLNRKQHRTASFLAGILRSESDMPGEKKLTWMRLFDTFLTIYPRRMSTYAAPLNLTGGDDRVGVLLMSGGDRRTFFSRRSVTFDGYPRPSLRADGISWTNQAALVACRYRFPLVCG